MCLGEIEVTLLFTETTVHFLQGKFKVEITINFALYTMFMLMVQDPITTRKLNSWNYY